MESIEPVLASWAGFYGYLGAVAATLLGLLFVSVSLRLNIFQQQEVRDVRDFALLTFGTFFCLIVISGLFLIPHQTRLGFGLPLLALGVLGTAGSALVALETQRVNVDEFTPPWWALPAWALVVLTYLGMLVIGGLVIGGWTGAIEWLVLVDAALLTIATASAWLLLSNAAPA
jgi:hypothetical protein